MTLYCGSIRRGCCKENKTIERKFANDIVDLTDLFALAKTFAVCVVNIEAKVFR